MKLSESKPAEIQEGKDVFISYSRKDEAFVRWLNDQFTAHEREPWIDWSGIQPGEKWWPSILRGIDSANTFIFVLSPDSVQSRVCCKEIDLETRSADEKAFLLSVGNRIRLAYSA